MLERWRFWRYKELDVRNWKKVAKDRDSWKKAAEQARTLQVVALYKKKIQTKELGIV